ncbi:HalOD1 output domain-containing protein [Halomicroarcula sp. GCM10025324]|uniref:HalOD1 output domain-containing protein n=1 Tax=Haloarcula TaxID=2237 RepID=UPI0023E7A452|nr:HalOD1 output domain-containing protein [Halomicroarcula sp. ZS-22-S1]
MERFSRDETAATWYELTDGQTRSDGVVRAVSAVTGLLPAVPLDGDAGSDDVMDPLASVIDPDALDNLFERSDDGAVTSITFSYHGLSVTVDASGIIRVSPDEATAESPTRTRVPAPECLRETAGQ